MSYGKLKNREVFRATVEGTEYVFTCYTQNCGTHTRELCCKGFSNTTESKYIKEDIVGKDIWYNRPWYSFKYANALAKGIKAAAPNKEVADKLHAILIDKTIEDEREETDKFIEKFKAVHESLNQENKDRLIRVVDSLPNGMITTQEQANMISQYATMLSVLQ